MIKIQLDANGDPIRQLTESEIATLRYEQMFFAVINGYQCFIQNGEETNSDPEIREAYDAVQLILNNPSSNSNSENVFSIPRNTSDLALLKLAEAIKIAQINQGVTHL
jgi:hypothetical protein